MTSFHGLSALKAIALGAALSMTAGFAFAADSNVSADQIVNALRAKAPTRGLSAAPQADPATRIKEFSFVGQVRKHALDVGATDHLVGEKHAANTSGTVDLEMVCRGARETPAT